MPQNLDTPISLETLADLTSALGSEVRARVHSDALDTERSELDPEGAIRLIDLGPALRARTPSAPAALAVLFVDETRDGRLVRDLADDTEGWHGYATVAPPARYMAVFLTGGRAPQEMLAHTPAREDLYRQIARALDMALCPAGCDLETAVAPDRSLGEERARLIGRTLALRDAGARPGADAVLPEVLSRPLHADPDVRARCGAFLTERLAA